LSYSALKSMHAWNFATSDQDPQKCSATMVTELAGAAGEKLQDLGYSALTMLSDKATQAGSAVWAEVRVQAPALGQVLLQEAHHLASVATDAARDGLSLLSGNPLQFDAIEVHFEGAVAQAPHLNQSEVLPTSVLPAGLDGNAPVDFGAAVEGNDDFGGVQEVEQMGLNVMVAPEGQEDFDAYYAAQQAFEGMSLHNHLGHSTTVMAC
ncbi:hypothetical protein, partial [Acidovorax sp. CCYZU-2555]|uniref:hypothetical protein n=1 Tax=Acidovorax sp. CCYZU-2555 TaxID=2835042 RepID=UPI001BD193CF